MVWADMKHFIRKKFCATLEDLKEAVREFNEKMTPAYCQKYIKKLKEVCMNKFSIYDTYNLNSLLQVTQVVIEKKGEWSNV